MHSWLRAGCKWQYNCTKFGVFGRLARNEMSLVRSPFGKKHDLIGLFKAMERLERKAAFKAFGQGQCLFVQHGQEFGHPTGLYRYFCAFEYHTDGNIAAHSLRR